jgi:hypothetical protein
MTWRADVLKYLRRKRLATETDDGWDTVNEAIGLMDANPDLDGPQLIRLAYWGTPGDPSWIPLEKPRE